MLRWAGLVHRQQHEHRLLSRFGDLRGLPHARCSISPIRWSSSAATVQQPKSRHSGTSQASPAGSIPTTTQPASQSFSHVITLVEDLLSQSVDDAMILKAIRPSPVLFQHLTNPESARKLAEALASTQYPLRSLRLLAVAHTLGCKFKHNAYECVSLHLAAKRHWNGVLSAVSLAKQHLGRTSSRLLNWRTRALVETEDYAGLQGIIGEFKEGGFLPTRRTFHLILSAHIRNHNLSMAKKCFVAMTEAGCPPDASTDAIVATHYRGLGPDPHVEARSLEALSDVKATTATAVVNSLMQLRLDAHDLPGALRLLALFNPNDVGAIITTMTAGNGVSSKSTTSHESNPTHPIRQSLQPNAATYSLFIDYQASLSNLSGALHILDTMLAAGIKPTPGTVTSLIHVFFAVGQGDLAVRMVANMCNAGAPQPSMFEPLLSAQTTNDLPWFPSGLAPTTRVFNSLLRGVLRTHGLGSTDTVLRIMHASNVRPTAATLEILMTHVSKVERSHPGVLFHLLRQFSSPDIQPTLRHMHIILRCVVRDEKYLFYGRGWDTIAAKYSTRRKELERHYPEHRISVESNSFDPTAGIALPKAHRRLARSSIQSLLSRKILSDIPMFSLRLRHDALIESDMDSAKDIFDTLLNRGMHPNEYHFSALMEGLARSGNVEGALDVMRSAIRAGLKPNVVMFTILIVGHARQGNPDKAIRVFQDMASSGVRPDVPSIDAVVSAFFVVGAYNMAKKVLASLWAYIQPFPDELRNVPLKTLARTFRSLDDKNRNGVKPPSKQERLALRLKLNGLRVLWENGSTEQSKASMLRRRNTVRPS